MSSIILQDKCAISGINSAQKFLHNSLKQSFRSLPNYFNISVNQIQRQDITCLKRSIEVEEGATRLNSECVSGSATLLVHSSWAIIPSHDIRNSRRSNCTRGIVVAIITSIFRFRRQRGQYPRSHNEAG